ncbi:MAG: hypothetical protein ABIP21_07855 [Acidimicrobiia bacterium]
MTCDRSVEPTPTSGADAATPACVLTPEQTEGPFYLDDATVRSDITEGRPGVPLELEFAVVDAQQCTPMSGVAVDIWHCDALGEYSGTDRTRKVQAATSTR